MIVAEAAVLVADAAVIVADAAVIVADAAVIVAVAAVIVGIVLNAFAAPVEQWRAIYGEKRKMGSLPLTSFFSLHVIRYRKSPLKQETQKFHSQRSRRKSRSFCTLLFDCGTRKFEFV